MMKVPTLDTASRVLTGILLASAIGGGAMLVSHEVALARVSTELQEVRETQHTSRASALMRVDNLELRIQREQERTNERLDNIQNLILQIYREMPKDRGTPRE